LPNTVKLDEHDLNRSVSEQLRSFLKDNAVRVIDLFRDWDEDGSGNISQEEFRKAMALLGVQAGKEVVDGCFGQFNVEGSGSIEYSELDKLLRISGSKDIWLDHSLAPKSVETAMTQSDEVTTYKRPTRASKVSAMCAAFGYPKMMSIAEYLESQRVEQ
jgi:hypothetical protein